MEQNEKKEIIKKKVIILNDNAVLGELDQILLEQEKAEKEDKETEEKNKQG